MNDDDLSTLIIGPDDILVIRAPATASTKQLDEMVGRLRDSNPTFAGRIIVVSHEFQLAKVSGAPS